MRILLVQPRVGGTRSFGGLAQVEPLGLESLAGALAGHEVLLLDLRLHDDLENQVYAFRPHVAAITCQFTSGVYRALETARRINAIRPDTHVIVGGMHPSMVPADFRDEAVEAVALGEGEGIVADAVNTLDGGTSLQDVPGLILNSNGDQFRTGRRTLQNDLDNLPFPRRDLLPVSRSRYYFNFWRPLALLETTRGCPYRCNFCSVWRFFRGHTRFKSPSRVIEEIERIKEDRVLVTDDNFLADLDRARDIAEGLLDRGIRKRFSLQVRADSIASSPEMVKLWYEAGMRHVFVGFEAASEEALARLRKGSGLSEAEKAMKVLSNYPDITVTGAFIVDPEFSREDFVRMKQYVRANRITIPQFSVLTPLPGTSLYKEQRDKLITNNWELFDLVHTVLPTKLGLEEFYEELAGLYKSFYSNRWLPVGRVPPILKGLLTRRYSLGQIRRVLDTVRVMSTGATYVEDHQRLAGKGLAGAATS